MGGIVAGGRIQRDAQRRIIREAEPVVVGLDVFVRRAQRCRRVTGDQWQQATAGIARPHIGINGRDEATTGRSVQRPTNAVALLAVLIICLAPQRVAHARRGHQIALIRCVHKHLRLHGAAVFERELCQPRALFHHGLQTRTKSHHDACLTRQFGEHLLRNLWLKRERRWPDEIHTRLRTPRHLRRSDIEDGLRILPIMFADALENLTCKSTEKFRAVGRPDIAPAKSARHHAAEMVSRLHEDHPLPHPRRLHRRDHSAGGAAVNADVGLHRRGMCGAQP